MTFLRVTEIITINPDGVVNVSTKFYDKSSKEFILWDPRMSQTNKNGWSSDWPTIQISQEIQVLYNKCLSSEFHRNIVLKRGFFLLFFFSFLRTECINIFLKTNLTDLTLYFSSSPHKYSQHSSACSRNSSLFYIQTLKEMITPS